ncbi:MAG: DUF1822 family protein [Almyronema sp.]
MITYPENLADSLEHEAIDTNAIALTASELVELAQLSQSTLAPDRQWQSYLNRLGLVGLEHWLAERSPDLSLNQQHSTLEQPAYNNLLLSAICNLQVGAFKLCLLTIGSLWDEVVSIPRAAVELADFIPHFYVLVQVEEDSSQVMIQGYLRHDQLSQQQTLATAEDDWTYSVPLSWFDLDADQLLLYLRCLDAAAMPLSAPPLDFASPAQLRQRLQALQPVIHADPTPIWQRLPWSLGAALFQQPDWVNWLYQTQQGQTPPLPAESSPASLGQAAINASLWLRNQLDQTAANLAWQLLPTLRPATALRSTASELETVLSELERSGVQLTPQARGAYRDISWEQGLLRLYAVAGALPSEPSEWSLLVIVGPRPGDRLLAGTYLRIRDAEQLLVEHTLEPHSPSSYLYGQVIGSLDEQFWVSIDLPSGTTIQLPPFAFMPDNEA